MATAGTILLIEDEPEIAELLTLFFGREGFRLLHATSGEEGLERLRDRGPRAILLDVGLPGIDGFEVCRRIRASSEVPIIMLTARDAEVDKIVGLELGADDYVSKPFSPRELVARVKAVLRRSEEQARCGSRDRYWGLRRGRRQARGQDDRRRRCPSHGARIRPVVGTSPNNRGLALTRGQILQSVWGYDYFGETRTVDVHIRQLRKKLPGIPIETVWGVGYRLEP